MGYFAVRLFNHDVDQLDPVVQELHEHLTELARTHGGALQSFAITRGVVIVPLTGRDAVATFSDLLETLTERDVSTTPDEDTFVERTKDLGR